MVTSVARHGHARGRRPHRERRPRLAQDRTKTKEIVVGLGAEPRTMLGVTIVDWTTNNMLEHIYDRLLDRDAKTFKPKPMLADELEDRQRHDVGVQASQGREVPQRRAVHRGLGQGHHRLGARSRHQESLRLGAYWGLVKEVQVVDDYTVRFVTKGPWPNLVDSAASTNSLIMPAKALKELGAGQARREADRHRAVQVRRVEA